MRGESLDDDIGSLSCRSLFLVGASDFASAEEELGEQLVRGWRGMRREVGLPVGVRLVFDEGDKNTESHAGVDALVGVEPVAEDHGEGEVDGFEDDAGLLGHCVEGGRRKERGTYSRMEGSINVRRTNNWGMTIRSSKRTFFGSDSRLREGSDQTSKPSQH